MNLRYVIDVNILMSILISAKSQYISMLSLFEFILPEFAFTELNLYKNVIKEKTRLDEYQFREYVYTVFSLLNFTPTFIQTNDAIEKANQLCAKVDVKDVSYVSLSIDTDLPFLTRDFKLYKGLRKQGFKKIELFEDFLNRV